MEKRKWLVKGDIVLIAVIIAVSAAVYGSYMLFFDKTENVQAEIIIKSDIVKTVDLNENMTFSIPEKENVIFEIKDGAIRFKESDCPDKICVHTGFLNKPMQTAVCLPNEISVRIIGKSKDEIDAVVR